MATKSSILVMTTEILHNMLCNDADTIRDLEIVIMDEVGAEKPVTNFLLSSGLIPCYPP